MNAYLHDTSEKGIIWFSDESGQVYKARLVNYRVEDEKNLFWARATCDCPAAVDIVVILKNGDVFPSGKVEWCGKTRLVRKEKITAPTNGQYLICLETAV